MMTSRAIAVYSFLNKVSGFGGGASLYYPCSRSDGGRLNYSSHEGTRFILLPVSSVHSSPPFHVMCALIWNIFFLLERLPLVATPSCDTFPVSVDGCLQSAKTV